MRSWAPALWTVPVSTASRALRGPGLPGALFLVPSFPLQWELRLEEGGRRLLGPTGGRLGHPALACARPFS